MVLPMQYRFDKRTYKRVQRSLHPDALFRLSSLSPKRVAELS